MDTVPGETRTLRRTMRDLVALSALPAVWAGYLPLQVAEGLADVLLSTLRLDLVYLRLAGQTEGQEVEVARAAGRPATPEQTRDLGRALAPWLDSGSADPAASIPNPAGSGTLRVVVVPIVYDRQGGVLVAGSQQTAFPSEEDRLLLRMAANQAAAALQQQRAAAALRESEEHHRSVIAALQEGVVVWDTDSRLIVFNASAERILGLSAEELEERRSSLDPRLRAIHEDGTPFSRETFPGAVALRTSQPSTNEVMGVYKPNGELTWIAVNAQPLFRAQELTPYAVITSFSDITARRWAEEELRRANARLELAVRGSNIGISDNDMPDGDFRHGRRYFVNIWEQLGYERPDLPHAHETSMGLVHPDDCAPLEEAIRSYLAGETSKFEVESRVRHKDGSYRWMLTRGVAVRDAGGKPIRFVGSAVDITDRKRAEEALRQSEERFRGTFENAAVGIAHAHPSGRFLRVNEKFCAIVGYPREELLQRTYQDITHPDDLAASIEVSAAVLRGGSPGLPLEKRYLRQDGALVWAELSISLQRDATGNPDYLIAIIQDISERKRLEGELRQAKEAAEAASRAKSEFLANVSHEIRTPMNAILGMTELALDTELTDDQRQCLRTVKSAADNLLGIINDLLDFAKVEAGKLELDVADFGLRAVVGDTLRALATRAHKKGLELACNVQSDVPDALVGDAGRLRQVLLNLVGNAVKFTERGEVVVEVQRLSTEDTDHTDEKDRNDSSSLSALSVSSVDTLRFSVRDTGIGIPNGKQERIFRAFEQEDTSTTRKYGGTGLGLAIAARLVALMGGSITVQSQPGGGSTFAFTARFGRQPHPAEQTPAWPPVLLQGLRVLVVDDNPTNRHILQEWLTGWQMDPVAVGDGLAAPGARRTRRRSRSISVTRPRMTAVRRRLVRRGQLMWAASRLPPATSASIGVNRRAFVSLTSVKETDGSAPKARSR
jgi:PAS domain S-box-containing protein